MRKLIVELAAIGAGAGLLSGCAGGSGEEPSPPPYDLMAPISAEDREAVIDAFDLTKKYWLSKQVGVEATKLVILEGGQWVTCPRQEERQQDYIARADNPRDVRYCRGTMSVIVSQSGINEMNHDMDQAMLEQEEKAKQPPDPDEEPFGRPDPISREEMRTHWWNVIQGHEFGHNIQQLNGVPKPKDNENDRGPEQQYEQQADCYAGAAIVEIDAAAFLQRTGFFRQIAPMHNRDSHGSSWDREGGFIEGAISGKAYCDRIVPR